MKHLISTMIPSWLKRMDSEAYLNRGLSYARLFGYERAIEDYDEAIRLDPQYAQAYYNRGIAYEVLWSRGKHYDWCGTLRYEKREHHRNNLKFAEWDKAKAKELGYTG
jgi:tetratricopeptide (TPR) repeat protein